MSQPHRISDETSIIWFFLVTWRTFEPPTAHSPLMYSWTCTRWKKKEKSSRLWEGSIPGPLACHADALSTGPRHLSLSKTVKLLQKSNHCFAPSSNPFFNPRLTALPNVSFFFFLGGPLSWSLYGFLSFSYCCRIRSKCFSDLLRMRSNFLVSGNVVTPDKGVAGTWGLGLRGVGVGLGVNTILGLGTRTLAGVLLSSSGSSFNFLTSACTKALVGSVARSSPTWETSPLKGWRTFFVQVHTWRLSCFSWARLRASGIESSASNTFRSATKSEALSKFESRVRSALAYAL